MSLKLHKNLVTISDTGSIDIPAGESYTVNGVPYGGIPTAITVANEASDTTCFPLFVTAATGDLGPKTNAGLTLNSATGNLGATLFNGLTLAPQSVGFTIAGGTTSKTLTVDETVSMSGKSNKLTPVATQTSNYTAAANEIVPCNISAGSFAVTLPSAPADGTRIRVQLLTVGTDKNLEVKTGGTDKFFAAAGPTSLYMYIYGETQDFQYQATGGFWNGVSSAPAQNFANQFPGVDAITPISNANITVDAVARTITITPPLGFFNIYVDGLGKTVKYRKGTVVFGDGSGTSGNNTWTDTSGPWFFYFNSAGQPVSTQTAWTVDDFPTAVPIYRCLWNATLSGAAKLVAQYVEYHVNDISADDHAWFHLYGAIWSSGFTMVNNALTTGDPNVDGRNTTIALTTGNNRDDNLEYTVTNSTAGTAWTQDLGNTTAASLNATNSAQFKIFVQDASSRVSFLPATRFPFDWNSGTNVPQFITATGTRTAVTNQRFMVTFVYATQNPVAGEPLKVVCATQDFTTLANARAYTWTNIQNTYSILGSDGEIRPLYRLIFEVHTSTPSAYTSAEKFSVLRETMDIRKAAVTSTTAASGSLPASSVTVVPAGTLAATNAQAALEELDTEKVPTSRTLTINGTALDLSADRSWTVTAGANNGLFYQVRCTSTANVTIASALEAGDTIDGITLAEGDKVLLKNQTAPAENGVYVAVATGAGAASRATDYDGDLEIRSSKVLVQEGTANAGFIWACDNTSAITVGSTSITYTRTFYEIIQSSVQYTCKTSGGDFSSIADFVTFVNQYAISGNAYVDLIVDAGTWILTSGILINHPNKDRIRIYGTRSTINLAASNSIVSVGSRTQEGATNYWYRDYVIDVDSTTGVSQYDFLLIPQGIANGTYPEFLYGCHEIQTVNSSTRLTIRVYNSVLNNSTYIAGGSITGAVYVIKTLLDIRTALTYEGIGLIDGVVFKYYTAFSSVAQNGKSQFQYCGWYGGARGMTTGSNAIVNFISPCAMSRNGTDECTMLFNVNTTALGNLIINGSGLIGVSIKGNSTVTTVLYAIGNNGNGVCIERFSRHSCVGTKSIANNGYGVYCVTFSPVFIQNGISYLNVNTDHYSAAGAFQHIFGTYTKTITGTTSTSNKLITSMTNTLYLKVGMAIAGTGIPTGATIASIYSTTQITMTASTNGTANGANSHTYTPTFSPAINGTPANNNAYITDLAI